MGKIIAIANQKGGVGIYYACGTVISGEKYQKADITTKSPLSGSTYDLENSENAKITGQVQTNERHDILYINSFTVYRLPSTGGLGIFWYMFSGVLLLTVASLITYRKKCKEVLRS